MCDTAYIFVVVALLSMGYLPKSVLTKREGSGKGENNDKRTDK